MCALCVNWFKPSTSHYIVYTLHIQYIVQWMMLAGVLLLWQWFWLLLLICRCCWNWFLFTWTTAPMLSMCVVKPYATPPLTMSARSTNGTQRKLFLSTDIRNFVSSDSMVRLINTNPSVTFNDGKCWIFHLNCSKIKIAIVLSKVKKKSILDASHRPTKWSS